MALTSQLSKYVSSRIRDRGMDYYRSGAVEIVNGDSEELLAVVLGSEAYEIDLFREDKTLYGACTCPYCKGELDICKHLWATLLAAEKKGYLRGEDNTDPLRLELDFEEEEEDEEEDMEYQIVFPPSRSRKGQKPSLCLVPPPPDWKDHLSSLRRELQARQAQAPKSWPENRQIVYLIDVEGTLHGKGLIIQVSHREMKKNGEWSPLKSSTDAYANPENLRDAADQRILGLLHGSDDAAEYGYSSIHYYNYYSKAIFRRLVTSNLQEHLVPLLCQTGRCFLQTDSDIHLGEPLQWEEGDPWELSLAAEREEASQTYIISATLQRGEECVPLEKPTLLVGGGLVFFGNKVSRFHDEGAFGWVAFLRKQRSLRVPFAQGEALVQELLEMPGLPSLSLPEELQYEEVCVTPQRQVAISSPQRRNRWGPDRLNWELSFDYEGQKVAYEDPRRGFLLSEPRRFLLRDFTAEEEAFERLRNLGFREFTSYGDVRRELAPRNLPRAVRELIPLGWHVEAEGKVYRRPGALSLGVTSGIDWFELHGEVQFDDRVAKLPDLLAALKRGDSLVSLDDGTFGMLPEEWLKKYGLLAGLGTPQEGHLRFSRTQVGLLDALLVSQPEATCDEAFQRLRNELRHFDGIQPCDAGEGFVGALRGYQKDGLGWLHFLRKFGFGGCLADDMGLGKTVQVLALLEARRELREKGASNPPSGSGIGGEPVSSPEAPGTSLVVAPKSLIFNWIQEAARFTPNLRVLDHTGTGRLKPGEHFRDYDLIVTTYGILRSDALEFKDAKFDYCILDEGQAIKNANTQTAKSARLVNANHRLILSGTPIENHLGELWSLFEFLNPGMLGAASVFQLSTTKARNPEPETRELLAHALRPFILRRTKSQVAKDLPDKVEQTVYCELEPKQRKLYNELRDYYRGSLLKRIEDVGLSKAKIQVLEALLRLRQAACHPALLDQKNKAPSAKFDLLLPQLVEVLSENHKVLVFSQFTSLLSLLKTELDKEKVVYLYLDGQTSNRGAIVEQFQNDPNCKLFLISLKAGGLGLNLTAAEYVFLLDPWWNPAVEAQAIDRTHRIGQTRRVFAYRLIARDTVEEKVLELQQTKRDLADAIINADNSLIRNLAKEDLELLMS